jgi:hypothetical protein
VHAGHVFTRRAAPPAIGNRPNRRSARRSHAARRILLAQLRSAGVAQSRNQAQMTAEQAPLAIAVSRHRPAENRVVAELPTRWRT